MKKRSSYLFSIAVSIIVMVIIDGCSTYQSVTAYFNTYYNAQKLFKEAEDDLARTQRPDRDTNYFAPYNPAGTQTKFDKVVEKCSKLIQYYPQSSLVDDAIMLIGKSSVYLNETETAIRKFNELLTNFPESNLRYEAKLWNAKALFYAAKEEEALKAIDELFPEAVLAGEDEVALEAQMVAAQMFFKKGDYDEVIIRLEKTKELSGDKLLMAIGQYQLATCYDRMGEYENAAEAYKNVSNYQPDVNLQFRSKLRYGVMLAFAEQTEKALITFQDMNEDNLRPEEQALVDHEVANVYADLGDTAKAFGLYQYVDTTYRRTEAAAKSYYRQGLLFEEQLGDFKTAKSYYEKAKTESQTADVLPFATRRSMYLTKYFAVKGNIHKYDSIGVAMLKADTLEGKRQDSLKKIQAKNDSLGLIVSMRRDSINIAEGRSSSEEDGFVSSIARDSINKAEGKQGLSELNGIQTSIRRDSINKAEGKGEYSESAKHERKKGEAIGIESSISKDSINIEGKRKLFSESAKNERKKGESNGIESSLSRDSINIKGKEKQFSESSKREQRENDSIVHPVNEGEGGHPVIAQEEGNKEGAEKPNLKTEPKNLESLLNEEFKKGDSSKNNLKGVIPQEEKSEIVKEGENSKAITEEEGEQEDSSITENEESDSTESEQSNDEIAENSDESNESADSTETVKKENSIKTAEEKTPVSAEPKVGASFRHSKTITPPVKTIGKDAGKSIVKDTIKNAYNDSLRRRHMLPVNVPQMQQAAGLTFDSLDEARAQQYYELASLFLLDMELVDSAKLMYQKIIDDYPGSTVKPKAMYALSELYRSLDDTCAVDSIYQILADEYPKSEYGKHVRKYFGLVEDSVHKVDSALERYSQINILTDSTNATATIQKLQSLVEEFPVSQYAAKAQYAIGWIYENILNQNDSAAIEYQKLIDWFPTSMYVESVRPKLVVKDHPDSLSRFVHVKQIELLAMPEKRNKKGAPGQTDDQNDDEHRSPRDRFRNRDQDPDEENIDQEEQEQQDEEPPPEEEKEEEPTKDDDDGGGGGLR